MGSVGLVLPGCLLLSLIPVGLGVSLKEMLRDYNYKNKEDDFQQMFYERNEKIYQKILQDQKEGKSMKVDRKLWNGLDESHSPDIIFLNSYQGPQGILDHYNVKNISHISHAMAESVYFKMVESIHVLCRKMKRFGNQGDGGWDLCVAPPYNLQSDCLVYSFGINFDFSFDDTLGKEYNCTVKSFDPSMSDLDHVRSDNVHFYQIGLGPENAITHDRWVIKSLKTIRKYLEHSKRTIDVLKIDIEFSEWESLAAMIQDKSLLSVKQLIFEAHTQDLFRTEVANPAESYLKLFSILSQLETETPFRKYHCHPNPDGSFISEFTKGGAMREDLCWILDEHRSRLVRELDVEHNLLNVLVSKRVIDSDHLEDIKSIPTRRGKVERLLDILKLRDDRCYNDFREAVQKGQSDLVRSCLSLDPVKETKR